MMIIYGIHPVREALHTRPHEFRRIFLSKKKPDAAVQTLLDKARQYKIPVAAETNEGLDRLSRHQNHQGVAAEVSEFPMADLQDILDEPLPADKKKTFLVADSIQDPHNFGAIIRSAVCSGVDAVIFAKDRACPVTAAVAKASAGAVEHIRLCRVVNIAAAMETLKKNGVWIIGLDAAASETIYGFDFNRNLAVVIGNEEKGIRALVKHRCDILLSIPMSGPVASLNASASASVVLFEMVRQRRR